MARIPAVNILLWQKAIWPLRSQIRTKMNIAEKYLKKQFNLEEFRRSFIEEKVKLDIEYRLEELKKDIRTQKSPEELIKKVDSIEQFVMSA